MAENTRIITLSREQMAEASIVLALAFEHDPLVNYLLGSHTPDQRRAFFAYSCAVRFDLDWPVLGCLDGDQLAGVACVSMPEPKEWPESLRQTYKRLGEMIGPQPVQRMEAYARLSDGLRPSEPHVYLGVIGIHPLFQGMGYGKLLLDAVQDISRQHPTSIGVALDTEKPSNVRFYEHNGYHIHSQSRIDSLDVWCMLRPN